MAVDSISRRMPLTTRSAVLAWPPPPPLPPVPSEAASPAPWPALGVLQLLDASPCAAPHRCATGAAASPALARAAGRNDCWLDRDTGWAATASAGLLDRNTGWGAAAGAAACTSPMPSAAAAAAAGLASSSSSRQGQGGRSTTVPAADPPLQASAGSTGGGPAATPAEAAALSMRSRALAFRAPRTFAGLLTHTCWPNKGQLSPGVGRGESGSCGRASRRRGPAWPPPSTAPRAATPPACGQGSTAREDPGRCTCSSLRRLNPGLHLSRK